jgi:hypothetical protein
MRRLLSVTTNEGEDVFARNSYKVKGEVKLSL